jgi:hypothetical protein
MNNQAQKIYVAIGLSLIVLSLAGLSLYYAFAKPTNIFITIILIAVCFLGIWLARKGVFDRYKALKANGYKIQAKVQYISLERVRTSFGNEIGTARPAEIYKIVCEGESTTSHTKKTYKSDDMHLAPDIDVTSQPSLDVYVDKSNPDNYWVDISKVPVKMMKLGTYPQLQLQFQAGQIFYKSVDGINYIPDKNL